MEQDLDDALGHSSATTSLYVGIPVACTLLSTVAGLFRLGVLTEMTRCGGSNSNDKSCRRMLGILPVVQDGGSLCVQLLLSHLH